ncbi:hypothetical protein BITS_1790 [Bifidobacterium tsurumiense]|uniref:Uncharacterized protein n=1 Tax=Bifidobacterium tsurumiense TaxID=356829 RepID=A0A087EDD5_9BIFI|nr:hypothetical protein BITS_1790 [Bifidobacterium tsurumiense]
MIILSCGKYQANLPLSHGIHSSQIHAYIDRSIPDIAFEYEEDSQLPESDDAVRCSYDRMNTREKVCKQCDDKR